MYKLIAIDLDGTLLTDDKKITSHNIRFLKHIINLGYEVVIATGRGYYSARELTKELTKDLEKPLVYVSNNGNVVRDSKDDMDIAIRLLDLENLQIIFKEGQARKLLPIIHVDHFHNGYDIIVTKETIEQDHYKSYIEPNYRYKEITGYEETIDRIVCIVYPGNHPDLEDFKNYIVERFPESFATHIMENVNHAEGLFEIMHPLGTKWNGIMEYAKIRGIKVEEIIAIGDDNNDLDMIRQAGLGIAMKNASSQAKSVSDIISEKDNNYSGVSHELKKVLKL